MLVVNNKNISKVIKNTIKALKKTKFSKYERLIILK